jgi:hypothetical protein
VLRRRIPSNDCRASDQGPKLAPITPLKHFLTLVGHSSCNQGVETGHQLTSSGPYPLWLTSLGSLDQPGLG